LCAPQPPRNSLVLENDTHEGALTPTGFRPSIHIVPGGARETWTGFADTPSPGGTKFHVSFRSMAVKARCAALGFRSAPPRLRPAPRAAAAAPRPRRAPHRAAMPRTDPGARAWRAPGGRAAAHARVAQRGVNDGGCLRCAARAIRRAPAARRAR
jgi:hypothetical protein